MKRFLLISISVLTILGANAQETHLIELNNGVTTEGILIGENESTIRLKDKKENIRVFYKEDIKNISTIGLEKSNIVLEKSNSQQTKTRTLFFSKERYQHEILLSLPIMWGWYKDALMINLNYIGGFYLNDFVFLGVGTGLDFSISNTMQAVAIPIYPHIRTYFSTNKWAPFLALSGGMRISYASGYSHWGGTEGIISGMLEIMLGIRHKINDKIAINFQCGYAMRNLDVGYYQYHGFALKVGVSF